jgi:hypothetical protein
MHASVPFTLQVVAQQVMQRQKEAKALSHIAFIVLVHFTHHTITLTVSSTTNILQYKYQFNVAGGCAARDAASEGGCPVVCDTFSTCANMAKFLCILAAGGCAAGDAAPEGG